MCDGAPESRNWLKGSPEGGDSFANGGDVWMDEFFDADLA